MWALFVYVSTPVAAKRFHFQMSVCCEVGGAKMATPASQDKKDLDYLEKLIKFFALKSAQIIVQARLGGKVQTECNPNSTQTDWVSDFNSWILIMGLYMFLFLYMLFLALTNRFFVQIEL